MQSKEVLLSNTKPKIDKITIGTVIVEATLKLDPLLNTLLNILILLNLIIYFFVIIK